MYKYMYNVIDSSTMFTKVKHRELIDKYSEGGWRFVSAIPSEFEFNGKIRKFDLVFEKIKG